MKEYLLGVAGIVLFSSIILAILPTGKMNELIKNIARMACLLCILSPFVDLLLKNEKLSSYFGESGIEIQTEFIQYSNEERVSEAENLLKNEIHEIVPSLFDIDILWTAVSVKQDGISEEKIRIEQINMLVEKELSESEKSSIFAYLNTQYGCKNIQIAVVNYG